MEGQDAAQEIETGAGNAKRSRNKSRRKKRRRSTPNTARSRTALSSFSLNRSESVDPVSSQVLLEDPLQRSLSGVETERMHREKGEIQSAFKSVENWITEEESRPKVRSLQYSYYLCSEFKLHFSLTRVRRWHHWIPWRQSSSNQRFRGPDPREDCRRGCLLRRRSSCRPWTREASNSGSSRPPRRW